MNFFRLVLLFALDRAEEARDYITTVGWPAIQRKLNDTYRLLMILVVAAAVTLISGVSIGFIGEEGGTAQIIGQGILRIGGVLVTFLMLMLYLRIRTYSKMLEVAAGVVATAHIPFAGYLWGWAHRFPRWIAGLASWITIALVYSMVVPIWRYPLVSAIAAVAAMGLAYVVAAEWFQSKVGRYVGAAFLVITFVGVTVVQCIRPEIVESGLANAERVLGGVKTDAERTKAMNSIAKAADRAANQTAQELLQEKMTERNRIQERARILCGGEFCPPDDRAKAAALDKDIEDLRDGTYWSKRMEVKPTPPASASATVVVTPPPAPTATTPSPSTGTPKGKIASQIRDEYPELFN